MRIFFIGDIVGQPGREIVTQALPGLRKQRRIDLVIANAENADGGSGLTPASYKMLIKSGVDCITLGDHVYRKREILKILQTKEDIVKPANYPDEAPGRCWTIARSQQGTAVAVFCMLGRVFMKPVDCPFKAANRVLSEIPADVKVRVLDFHAEATSDMQLMGRHLDGRVSAVLGTHTHVATADEQIFPGGTAFQCDVGMTGPHDSILGRRIDRVMETTLTAWPTSFNVATGDVRISGTIVDVNEETGRATAIERVSVNESQASELAASASEPADKIPK